MNYNLIKSGVLLPEDFVIDGVLNRDKYIIEFGFPELNKWYDEHQCLVSAEVIGAIVIGSDAYCDFRWRIRLPADQKFDLTKTDIGKMINAWINI